MASPAVDGEVLRSLRHKIAKIEGIQPERLNDSDDTVPGLVLRHGGRPVGDHIATGAERFDAALGGGLPGAGLIEIHGAATRDSGAVAGFVMALARLAVRRTGLLIWIGTREIFREAGRPYAPGLMARFDIQPENLLLAEADKLADVLWIAEEAANLTALATVVLEVRGSARMLDLTATRRLNRRALEAHHPLFLMRQAGNPEPTAAPVRLIVAPSASRYRETLAGPLTGSIGPPAFDVLIDKSRTSPPATFTLEWNGDINAFEERDYVLPAKNTGTVAAAAADGSGLPTALRRVVAFADAPKRASPGGQPARGKYPAHRSAGGAR